MSTEEYTHRNFWTSNQQVKWVQEQEKLVVMKIQEDLDKWFVATSPCPTVYKITTQNDKTI
jgi:hypothetical protein